MPFLLCLIVILFGCSGPEHAPVDHEAFTDADTDDLSAPDEAACDMTVAAPAAPTLPAPVDWGDPPAGWERADDAGHRYFLPLIAAVCAAGTMPLVGSTDCVTAGEEPLFPDGAVVVGVAAGDDLQAALDAAPDDAVVLVAAGTFTTPVVLKGRLLTLFGDAAGGTLLTGGIVVEGGTLLLRGLSVRNDVGWAIAATAGATLDARRVLVSGGASGGLRGRDAVIRLTDTSIVGASHYGVRIGETDTIDGGSFSAEGLLVRGIVSDPAVDRGKGMEFHGATVTLTATVVEDVRYGGISVVGSFDADLLVVRRVVPSPHSGVFGYGIALIDDFSARMSRALVSDVRTFGIAALGSDTGATTAELELEDALIETVRTQTAPDFPATGLDVEGYATVTARRVAVRDGDNVGLLVMGPLAEGVAVLNAEDATVERIDADPYTGAAGVGIAFLNGVDATLRRTLVAETRQFGVQVSAYEDFADYTVQSRFEDLTVRDTLGAGDGSAGIGMGIYRRAEVTLDRARFEENRTAGLLVYGDEAGDCDTTLAATDLAVRGTRGQELDGEHGIGLAVQYGAAVSVRRALFEQNRMYGLMAFGVIGDDLPRVTLIDTTSAHTLPRDCLALPDDCPYAPGVPIAHGAGVYNGARLSLGGVLIEDNLHGLDIAAARVDALPAHEDHFCAIFRDNEVAVNGWDLPDGYDIADALGAVCIEGDGVPFSGDQAPVPDPVDR